MTQLGLYARIAAIIIVMVGALWTVNVIRSAGRLQAELEQLKAQHEELVASNAALLETANTKARDERSLRVKFDQLKRLAMESTNACDSEPLPAAYVEQLRTAAAAASLSEDSTGVVGADATASAADHGR